MKILGFIPVRLESKRFPNKVLFNIYGIPMFEHVRRRAILSKIFKDVYVVSNSRFIKKKVQNYKAKVISTSEKHFNGTSRVSEISKKLNFNYAFILFGDEPFLNINMLKHCFKEIKKDKKSLVFNVVTNLKKGDNESSEVVKTVLDNKKNIINYFRNHKTNIRKKLKKSSGILILKKEIIDNYKFFKIKEKEKKFSIEQFRFLENGIPIKSIFYKNLYQSVNTRLELKNLLSLVKKDEKEIKIIKKLNQFDNRKL